MRHLIIFVISVLIISILIVSLISCSSSGNKISKLPGESININDNINQDPNGGSVPQDADMNWDIKIKGYNVVEPPATLTLSIKRMDQPISDYVYKYQLNDDEPWIDVTSQVNAVGIGEYCDIPLTFTTPGKYWITTKIFFDETEWTGLYNTDFVIILEPEK